MQKVAGDHLDLVPAGRHVQVDSIKTTVF